MPLVVGARISARISGRIAARRPQPRHLFLTYAHVHFRAWHVAAFVRLLCAIPGPATPGFTLVAMSRISAAVFLLLRQWLSRHCAAFQQPALCSHAGIALPLPHGCVEDKISPHTHHRTFSPCARTRTVFACGVCQRRVGAGDDVTAKHLDRYMVVVVVYQYGVLLPTPPPSFPIPAVP